MTIEKNCAFSGHRLLGNDFNSENLECCIIESINQGYTGFYVGMALGFDTICFRILEKLREVYDIKIIACIPCENQADKFSQFDREEYFRMIDVADEKIVLNANYHRGCMQQRNKFMIDNCSKLICYLRENKGGTMFTVNYAKNKNLEIIYI